MKKILNIMFNRWTLAILGLIAVSLLIWFIGPLFAVADYHPLESGDARFLLIGLIVLFYIAKQLWAFIKSKNLNKKLMDGLLQQSAPQAQENEAGAEEIAVLHKRFEEAVNILKKTNKLGKKEKSGIFSLLSRQYLYELPWYIFIGPPGSGKTTALINSGLQFPLAEHFGKDKIGGIGGTRNCDWWFTDEAVLIDTAGRYTTHENDQAADSSAWTGFLNLLKKYRPRRPINGVIVTISVSDLLQQNALQREKQANEIRKRIQELYDELNIQFPIYILVTKTDLLVGFMEFFGRLGRDEREQVWGTSFKLADDENHHPLSNYVAEFTALEKRLYDRLIFILQEERDIQKRALLYLFPQQFSNLKNTLEEYLNQIFSPSRYEQQPLLRGIYFTSGTQTGNPIDRMMGNLAQALNLGNKLISPLRPSGKSFFLTRLLKEVIFTESELAGTNQRWEHKQFSLQWIIFTAGILLTLGMSAAWTLSYVKNKAYITEVEDKINIVSSEVESLPQMQNINIVNLLPTLRSVQELTRVSSSYDGSTPIDMRFGLYQGEKLSAASNNAYYRLLQDTFLLQLILRLEYLLNYTSRNDPELLYEALKAYIMLHDAKHFDAIALKAFIIMDWETNFPHELTKEQYHLLEHHLNNLFSRGAPTPPIRMNEQIVKSVRDILSQTPIAQRIYNRLKRQNIGIDLPEFTILRAVGPSASLVFSRRSGRPLNQGVPGLYTYNGYYKTFFQVSKEVAEQLKNEEKWVLQPEIQVDSKLPINFMEDQLLDEVKRLYLQDYARTWETFIADIRLIHSDSLQESIDITRLLSANDSPLVLLLKSIVKEVTLVKTDDAERNVFDKATDSVRNTSERLKRLIGQGENKPSTVAFISRPENIVDDRFNDLRNIVSAPNPGQPAPIESIVSQINELYMLLTSTEIALKSGTTPPSSEVINRIQADANKTPEPIRSMLTTLSTGGISQALGEKRANLNQALFANVTDFCRKAINNRYPFKKDSSDDVTPDDFSRIFSSGGLIDSFFQNYLSQYVDTTRQTWQFRNVGDASMGTASRDLQQFQRAKIIQDVFFQGSGNKAGMELTFKPIDMDASITQFILDIDGQLVRYSHGPLIPVTVQWPGTRGSSQVRLQISLADSGSSLTGQVFEGPWALFRMFDKVQIARSNQPDKFIVNFNIENRKVQFEVSANSVMNPFRLQELELFSCPAKL
ncbi:type VI secretion system membrane subunit TssM [Nitrosomonas sp.]|uniref:type VI secretion system membrane subunit TssM n=1 Tax=Nitrosomonas sp. TaxID=42353 RepID=UPI00283C67A3|nr:type VI secretion system membrane subunit TssM [Nitrosomonas sp.]MDR4515598.1 type VI secretion system membrane subunit TssM [Nitrosomonas sp.]